MAASALSSFRASPHPRCPLRSLLCPNLATALCTAVRLGLPGKCDALAPVPRWWAPEGPPLPLARYLWPPPMAGLALPSPDQLMVAMPGDRSRLGRGTGCKGRRRGEGAGLAAAGGRGGDVGGAASPALPSPLLSAGGGKLGREVSGGPEGARPSPPPLGRGAALRSRREAGGLAAGGRAASGEGFPAPHKRKRAGQGPGEPLGVWGAVGRRARLRGGGCRPRASPFPRVPCDAGVWVRFVCFCQMWIQMERSEGGEQGQPQPWGKLIRLGAEEAEPHVLLLKREWTIGRKKGGRGTRCAGPGRCFGDSSGSPSWPLKR